MIHNSFKPMNHNPFKLDAITKRTSPTNETTPPKLWNQPKTQKPFKPTTRSNPKPRGVWKRLWGRFAAKIWDPWKKTHKWLGTFDMAKEATQAYDKATLSLCGPKATNFSFILPPPSLASLPPSLVRSEYKGYKIGVHDHSDSTRHQNLLTSREKALSFRFELIGTQFFKLEKKKNFFYLIKLMFIYFKIYELDFCFNFLLI